MFRQYVVASILVGSLIASFILFAFGQSDVPNYFSDAKLQASINMANWGGQWSASYNFSTTVTMPVTGTGQFVGQQYDAMNANGAVRGLEFRIDPVMCPCKKYVLLWGTTGKLNGRQLEPNTVYLLDTYGAYSLTEWTWGTVLFFKLEENPTVSPTSTATTVPATATPTATTVPATATPTATATTVSTVPAVSPTPTATTQPTKQVTLPKYFHLAQIQAYLNQKAFSGNWKADFAGVQANPIVGDNVHNIGADNVAGEARTSNFTVGKCEAVLLWGSTLTVNGKALSSNVVYYLPEGQYNLSNWTWGTWLLIAAPCEVFLPMIKR
jgi:hypothetical protein